LRSGAAFLSDVRMRAIVVVSFLMALAGAALSASVGDSMCVIDFLAPTDSDEDRQQRAERLAVMDAIGLKVHRVGFNWRKVEQQRGAFTPEYYDPLVDDVIAAGHRIIGLLGGGNRLYSEQGAAHGDDNYPPDDPEDFGPYVYAVVSHFKDRVSDWEVWNEPNAAYRFFKPKTDPYLYGAILKVAYTAAKEADPDCRVSFAGVFGSSLFDWFGVPGGLDFIEQVFAAHPDIGEYIDAVSFHPYPYPFTSPEFSNPWLGSYEEVIEDLRDLLSSHGIDDIPIWFTECGWPTNYATWGVTFERQAQYLVRSLLLSVAHGVEYYCWFTYRDREHWIWWQEDSFGLLDVDGRPKPSYVACGAMTGLLRDSEFDRDLSDVLKLPDGVYALMFRDGKRWTAAFWCVRYEEQIEVPLADVESVETFDTYGEPLEPTVLDDLLLVRAGPSPVYVVLTSDGFPIREPDSDDDVDDDAADDDSGGSGGCGC